MNWNGHFWDPRSSLDNLNTPKHRGKERDRNIFLKMLIGLKDRSMRPNMQTQKSQEEKKKEWTELKKWMNNKIIEKVFGLKKNLKVWVCRSKKSSTFPSGLMSKDSY